MNCEHCTANVRKSEVHLLLGVSEKPETGDFFRHPLGFVRSVSVREADEQKKASADLSGDTVTDADFGARDALKQYSQRLLDRY